MCNVLHFIITRKDYLNRTLIVQILKPTTDKWDPINKRYCHLTKKAAYKIGECQRLHQLYTRNKNLEIHLADDPVYYSCT